jgi:hypothetical protein
VVPSPPLVRNAGAALAEDAYRSLDRPTYQGQEVMEVNPIKPTTAPARRVVPQRGRSRQARGGCNQRVKGSRRSRNASRASAAARGDPSDLSEPPGSSRPPSLRGWRR